MDKNQELCAESEINQAEEIVIQAIAETMDLYGVTPAIGKLYATMYFKHDPLTLDEMKDEVGMSKPSMSTAVRQLQDINIVQRKWQKGSRKGHFVAEKNFFNYFSRFFGDKWKREAELNLSAIDEAIPRLEAVMEDESNEEKFTERARLDLEQLEEYRDYCHWLLKLTSSIESGEIFDFLPIKDSEK